MVYNSNCVRNGQEQSKFIKDCTSAPIRFRVGLECGKENKRNQYVNKKWSDRETLRKGQQKKTKVIWRINTCND